VVAHRRPEPIRKLPPADKNPSERGFRECASCWEIAIKVRSGKWSEAEGLVPGIADVLTRARLTPLPVTVPHAEHAGLLDFAHNDPFDRLLAAQALDEGLLLLSVDPVFRRVQGLSVA
jgi:PIN domain nuclease of toxin-antitoxin system